jgi:hypothetical protein
VCSHREAITVVPSISADGLYGQAQSGGEIEGEVPEGPTNKTNSAKPDLKKKAAHEAKELLIIFLYLAFFFCALATYSMLLLSEYHVSYLTYGFALINALVVAKVILIGDYVHLGKRYEGRPLFVSAIVKAFLFSLLVFAFHVLEEVIKRIVHGADIATASREMRIDELLGRALVVFCTFIPLFGFRELRRVMGEEEFRALLFRSRETGNPDLPTEN